MSSYGSVPNIWAIAPTVLGGGNPGPAYTLPFAPDAVITVGTSKIFRTVGSYGVPKDGGASAVWAGTRLFIPDWSVGVEAWDLASPWTLTSAATFLGYFVPGGASPDPNVLNVALAPYALLWVTTQTALYAMNASTSPPTWLNGGVFATRLSNVFVIGKGADPKNALISLPRGKGIKLTIFQQRDRGSATA